MIHPHPLKNFSILVVDDAVPPRKMLRRLLNTFGEFEYDEDVNVTNAKRKILSKKPYTLIFCDVILPESNGIEFLKWIRSGEAGEEIKNVPFVTFSSDLSKNTMNEAKEHGVSGFLDKPFSIGDLYHTLSAIFNWSPEVRKYFDQKMGLEL